MVRGVNSRSAQIRARRIAATEQRLIDAAARLFVERGYVATTLTEVAAAAGVAPRTVYLRFETKVALFKRTMDVMLVGDSAPVDVAHRDWMHHAVTAPTCAERIRLMARGTAEMFSRIGPLLAVSEQAAAIEPAIAAAAQAGREDTRDQLRRFWAALAVDGLLPAAADAVWLADTAVMTCSVDAYLHAMRTLGWSADAYADWLEKTWLRIADLAGRGDAPA
jgi:AcrR family transcriptional regulator